MRRLEIAMAMINQVDVYHLQRRTGPKEIGAAGLVGCFGGKREVGDTFKKTMVDELKGETTLDPSPSKIREIDEFEVESDHQNEPVEVEVHVFEVLLQHGDSFEATEGELVSWTREEIGKYGDQLTPATKKFFSRYFK